MTYIIYNVPKYYYKYKYIILYIQLVTNTYAFNIVFMRARVCE